MGSPSLPCGHSRLPLPHWETETLKDLPWWGCLWGVSGNKVVGRMRVHPAEVRVGCLGVGAGLTRGFGKWCRKLGQTTSSLGLQAAK